MNSTYYYAYPPSPSGNGLAAGSRASDELPLLVNCAGNIATPLPFSTHNAVGREDFYLLYVVTGSLRLWMPDGEHMLSTGDAVLFPPHFAYRYVYEGGEPLSYLWTHFTGSHANDFLRAYGFGALPCLHHAASGTGIVAAFRAIFEVFESKSSLQIHQLSCALQQLLLTVAIAIRPSETAERTLERSLGYIHAAYSGELRVPDLAAMENLSNSRYIALFHKKFGVSPSVYITRLRMSAACDLLARTDMSVKQIGALVGYDDPHFFSRVFKKQVGTPPLSYRRAAQGKT